MASRTDHKERKGAQADGDTVWLPVGALKRWEKNPRKNDPAVPRVAASIKRFGFVNPIVVWRSANRMVAGDTRLKAMKAILAEEPGFQAKHAPGPGLVRVLFCDFADEAEADLYALADNRLNEIAGWDETARDEILAAYPEDERIVAGFEAVVIHSELDGEDNAPEPPKVPVTQKGDLWLLGEHRLLCGDSTVPEDVARLMGNDKAAVMNTDPPYGIDYSKLKDGIPRPGFRNHQEIFGDIENDTLTDGAALQAFLESCIRTAVPHLVERCAFYLWHPMLTQGTFFAAAAAAAAADILIHRQIVWVKPGFVLTRSGMYHWQHELCFYGWRRGLQPPWYGEKNQTSVWTLGRDDDAGQHPTQKPVALFEPAMLNHTRAGEVVYEPFSGSGSQTIAAEKLGRKCRAIEIDPRYCDVAVSRWETMTGKKADRTRAAV